MSNGLRIQQFTIELLDTRLYPKESLEYKGAMLKNIITVCNAGIDIPEKELIFLDLLMHDLGFVSREDLNNFPFPGDCYRLVCDKILEGNGQ